MTALYNPTSDWVTDDLLERLVAELTPLPTIDYAALASRTKPREEDES